MKIVALDIDGVFAHFDTAFHDLLTSLGAKMTPLGDGPFVWDWPLAHGATPEEYRRGWDYVDAHPEWWGSHDRHTDVMKDLPLARFYLRQLTENLDLCTTYFVTNRWNGFNSTRNWLTGAMAVQLPYLNLITVPGKKSRLLRELQPDIIVEDRLSTLMECLDFPAERILVNRGYNRAEPHPGITRVDGTLDALAMAWRIVNE